MESIPFQLELKLPIPFVVGNHEYTSFRRILEKIDFLLTKGKVEEKAVAAMIQKAQGESGSKPLTLKRKMKIREVSVRALRCNILMSLNKKSFRSASFQLADSPLMQNFCGLVSLDRVSAPSKSTLESYSKCSVKLNCRDSSWA